MNIQVSHIPNSNILKNDSVPNKYSYVQKLNADLFISNANESVDDKKISFKGGFFKNFISKLQQKPEVPAYNEDDANASDFAKEIAVGIKNVMSSSDKLQCNIRPSAFKCIMSPSELNEILPSLKSENFICSSENINSGVYYIDLDYQSNYSKGTENVFTILDNVSKYADEYYEKNNKEFIFALTDRDSIEGLQHAVRYIGENPEKFKHVKFIPGIKLSFAHKAPSSGLGYENSEMLVYGINPYSKNLIDYVDRTIQKRKDMVINFIKQVNDLYPEFAYKVIEFVKQNGLKYKKDFGISNLYWRVREYAETKGDTEIKGMEMVPETIIKEAQSILDDLDKINLGSQQNTYSALGSQIIDVNDDVNKNIKSVFYEYSTHFDESKGRVVSPAENTYLDMIECLSQEKEKPVLALASPFYFTHYFAKSGENKMHDVIEFIRELEEESNGMLVAFESVAPFYDLDSLLTQTQIDTFNEHLRKNTDLYEVGGSFAKVK